MTGISTAGAALCGTSAQGRKALNELRGWIGETAAGQGCGGDKCVCPGEKVRLCIARTAQRLSHPNPLGPQRQKRWKALHWCINLYEPAVIVAGFPPKAAKPAFDGATTSTALLTRQVECNTVIAALAAIAPGPAAHYAHR